VFCGEEGVELAECECARGLCDCRRNETLDKERKKGKGKKMLTVKAVDDPGQLCQCFELGRDDRHGGTYDHTRESKTAIAK
jgi:hypothetical protein